jgi:hypothetical protein
MKFRLLVATGVLSLSVVLLVAVGVSEVYAYPIERSHGYDRQGGGDHGRYGGVGAESYGLKPGQYAAGTIASLQAAHENTLPIWIVSGHWKASMAEKEVVYQKENATGMTNVTSNLTTANMNPDMTKFGASIDMVMINGSAMHTHKIYNFTLNEMSMPDNETMMFNGTSTITLRDGPVHDVPTLITVMAGNAISIYPEPSAVNNHFGPTPIYGTVSKAIHVIK